MKWTEEIVERDDSLSGVLVVAGMQLGEGFGAGTSSPFSHYCVAATLFVIWLAWEVWRRLSRVRR
jgi:hypothetical protein